MRKISYRIAYLITKLLNKSHRFRFVCFYFAQITLTQTFQMSLYLFLAYKIGALYNLIVIMFFYFLSKKLTKPYHATSFESCTIISGVVMVGSAVCSKTSLECGILIPILFNLYAETNYGENQLDKISINIDKNVKKIRRGVKWILRKLKHL